MLPPRSGGVDADDRLDLQEIAQAEFAVLATVAGHLESAERSLHVARRAVQRHLSRADARADASRALRILGPYVSRESIRCVVRDGDGLLLVLVGQNAEHRSEDLLARNGHV